MKRKICRVVFGFPQEIEEIEKKYTTVIPLSKLRFQTLAESLTPNQRAGLIKYLLYSFGMNFVKNGEDIEISVEDPSYNYKVLLEKLAETRTQKVQV